MSPKLDLKKMFQRKKPDGDDGGVSNAGGVPHKVRRVAIWLKANILIVLLALVSISAVVAASLVSSAMAETNQAAAQSFGKFITDLTGLERTNVSVTVPGNPTTEGAVAVNPKLVEEVRTRLAGSETSNGGVTQAAVKHNQAGHRPLLSLRIPVGDSRRQQIHLDLHDELTARYDALLKRCRATLPPAEEDVMITLQRFKLSFIQAELNQTVDTLLTKDQQAKLSTELINRRLNAYRSVALEGGVYLDRSDIGAPSTAQKNGNFQKLWDLQWRFWITEDVLGACEKLNEGASIITGPVKRIVAIQFDRRLGDAAPPEGADTGAEGGEEIVDGSQPANPGVGASGAPVDPSAMVSMSNYGISFRGWSSNQLYDVYRTRVKLIVETAQIPIVTDSFARQNFMAITDIKITPVDPFVAIQEGYVYGEQPVSTLIMAIESVWLRQWTGPLMPDEVRAQLGTTGLVQSALAPDDASQVSSPPTQE
ncbi:MAG: hypothetical protein EXS15_08145 [Phycisphaerales bacterium]|nr:hypothetical protein [Phycisphaerales bacterium]